MDEALFDQLKPSFEGHYLLVAAFEGAGGTYFRPGDIPKISRSIGDLRGRVTRISGYRSDTLGCHVAFYKWDVDTEAWSLIDFIPKGTHKDDFPWRKKRKP